MSHQRMIRHLVQAVQKECLIGMIFYFYIMCDWCRMETVMNMCQFLSSSEQHAQDDSQLRSSPALIVEVAEELLLRWDLWTQDIGERLFIDTLV